MFRNAWDAALSIGVAIALLALARCAIAGDLPDPELTPGAVTTMSLRQICKTRWGKDRRFVTASMKRQVFASYGLSGNKDSSGGCHPDKHGRWHEVDHLISRELGGADTVSNLWAECYSGEWSAVKKDRLENRLHKDVCSGTISLAKAQKDIRTDWIAAYKRLFGEAPSK